MQLNSITVAVTCPGKEADKEILSLLANDPDCTVIRRGGSSQTSDSSRANSSADLLILDTGPAPESSLQEMLDDLSSPSSSVMIVAPDERYAVEAYQLRICGYVTRPLVPENFFRALEWAKIQVRRKAIEEQSQQMLLLAGAGEPRRTTPDRLMVRSRNHIHLIRIDDIDWIEANAGYSWIHTQGKKYLLRGKMKCLEESLPDDQFVRIHRSLIVNIDRIRELQHISRGEYHAILGDGTKLSVSRNYRSRLFSVFVKAS